MKRVVVTRHPKEIQAPKRWKPGIKPTTPSEFETLANELVEWAQKDDTLFFRDFAAQRGYVPQRFNTWGKDNEYFSDALEIARSLICSRRERAGLKRELDTNFIMKTHALYDYEYRDHLEKQADKGNSVQPIQVFIDSIPDTGIPAVKKDN